MNQFDFTQEEVAHKLSKSRPAVANTLRLLKLPDFIANYIAEGRLSSGHGRCLASISNPTLQKDLSLRAMKEELSVRQLEQLVKESNAPQQETEKVQKATPTQYPEFAEFKDTLQQGLGMKVDIKGDLNKGKITISYSKREELEGFYQLAKKLKD